MAAEQREGEVGLVKEQTALERSGRTSRRFYGAAVWTAAVNLSGNW